MDVKTYFTYVQYFSCCHSCSWLMGLIDWILFLIQVVLSSNQHSLFITGFNLNPVYGRRIPLRMVWGIIEELYLT
ncbi:hypothetical protein OIU77_007689 [Salix suchowensis]|uniref:Uncharacterized protein n=1 Tax=Salix suchowensis TaxID=1278906 RepID=A0ABQ9AIC4_9ROSI|nr:hypothetical protein OIU77_007689 [Salix suchowensis]